MYDPVKRREYYLKHREKSILDSKAWHKVNRDRWMETRRKHRKKLRETALSVLGGRCVRCLESDPIVLQIDHVKGGGRQDHKKYSNRSLPGYLKEVISDKTGKYQLLCANCNIRKYFTEEKA